jgi:hypothetical protein
MKDGAMGFSAAKKPVAVEEEGIGKHEKKDGVATDPEERKVRMALFRRYRHLI